MSFSNRHLQIKAKTWNRDSYGLYDYESANYRPQSLDITQPGKLIRSNNELVWVDISSEKHAEIEKSVKNKLGETLALVSENPGKKIRPNLFLFHYLCHFPILNFSVDGIRISPYTSVNSEAKKVWCTIGKEGHLNHELKQKDLIKLGRAIFRVRQVN